MLYNLIITKKARQDLIKLPAYIAQRIESKLNFFIKSSNPLFFSKPLKDLPPATHRFQIGDYRARFFIQDKVICITKIEIRGQAYRQ